MNQTEDYFDEDDDDVNPNQLVVVVGGGLSSSVSLALFEGITVSTSTSSVDNSLEKFIAIICSSRLFPSAFISS